VIKIGNWESKRRVGSFTAATFSDSDDGGFRFRSTHARWVFNGPQNIFNEGGRIFDFCVFNYESGLKV